LGQAVKSSRNRNVPAKVANVRLHPCRLRMGRLKVPCMGENLRKLR
jgi:hypothetical protein